MCICVCLVNLFLSVSLPVALIESGRLQSGEGEQQGGERYAANRSGSLSGGTRVNAFTRGGKHG